MIRVPKKTASKFWKYYVVKTETQAFSVWNSAIEAEAHVGRFALYDPEGFQEVEGVVAVNNDGRTWHAKKSWVLKT